MSYCADKFGDGRTDERTYTQTDAGNDNNRKPKLASGKNVPEAKENSRDHYFAINKQDMTLS